MYTKEMGSQGTRRQLSATEARNLRTLLLLNVFEPESIGRRIKQAREQAGLRQEDLADLLGVATRTVQNYESAGTKPYKHLNAMAAATGVTAEWLLHGDPTQPDVESAPVDRRLGQLADAVAALAAGQDEILRILQDEREDGQSRRPVHPRR